MFHVSLRHSVDVLNLLNKAVTHRRDQLALLFHNIVKHVLLSRLLYKVIKCYIFDSTYCCETKTFSVFFSLNFLFLLSLLFGLFCMMCYLLLQHTCEYISCLIMI